MAFLICAQESLDDANAMRHETEQKKKPNERTNEQKNKRDYPSMGPTIEQFPVAISRVTTYKTTGLAIVISWRSISRSLFK